MIDLLWLVILIVLIRIVVYGVAKGANRFSSKITRRSLHRRLIIEEVLKGSKFKHGYRNGKMWVDDGQVLWIENDAGYLKPAAVRENKP